MVSIQSSKIWRFLNGLHPSLAGLVDIGRDGSESYVDVVRHATRQESWSTMDKKLNSNADEWLNETTYFNQSQPFGNRQSSGRVGF